MVLRSGKDGVVSKQTEAFARLIVKRAVETVTQIGVLTIELACDIFQKIARLVRLRLPVRTLIQRLNQRAEMVRVIK